MTKNKKLSTYLLVFILMLPFITLAQQAVIRGFVYSKSNGEPVIGCGVIIKNSTKGTLTDANGFFIFNNLDPETYEIEIKSLEFESKTEIITVKKGDFIVKKFYLETGSGLVSDEIEIDGQKINQIESPNVGVQKIDPLVINKMPSIGEPDIAQYLQASPGIVSTGDQGGQLYIRGGLPVQNKVLLDGMIIYNPFHSIGLFSVFDTDVMKQADIYSAGFGSEYGGRTSAIMDISTRDGNKNKFNSKVSASLFGSKANFEGPIIKMSDENKASGSYIISAKTSYLPQSSKLFYTYANKNGLPFGFLDVYAKTSFNTANGSKINIFGFNFDDHVNYTDIAQFNWNALGVGSNFVLVPENMPTIVEGNFAYSSYKINYQGSDERDKKMSGMSGFNTGINFKRFFGSDEIKYGFDIVSSNTEYEIINPTYSKINYSKRSLEVATYVKYRWLEKKKFIVLEPSFRLQYYSSFGEVSPEPRFSMKINPGQFFENKERTGFSKYLASVMNSIRIKGSGGYYSQTLISATSDKDVVNLFYGFINGPEDLPKTYKNKDNETVTVSGAVQRAWHLVGGVEIDLIKNLELQIEGYRKYFNSIPNVNREKIYDDNSAYASQLDVQKKVFIMESGQVTGLDMILKYEYNRLYLWAAYSLTYNQRFLGNTTNGNVFEYAPVFDRRHNVNLLGSYTFGKKRNIELSVRWNYGSGFPFTPTQGYNVKINFNNNFNHDYTTGDGDLGYVPGTYNSQRLPDYHRLDVSVKWMYMITEKMKLETSLGATNIYNRGNIFYYDRMLNSRINQLPIMPNLNLALKF